MKTAFDSKEYVPVLRWKSSERESVCKLDVALKNRITPVLEFVPQEFEKGTLEFNLKILGVGIDYFLWISICLAIQDHPIAFRRLSAMLKVIISNQV